ncbi:4-hydroxy-tetrahydrodipicolinate synthase [Marispirochaeta sp.]|jgi:4-hydroxy-tetrahydrodipicolinate synthase|uniref:4-hydroxy-tetrahydrodipicolinate synthase n=1 Tax=Marispirochaeta sp. TaxID=2038653 RepID=UPI0029C882C8|nr:4-hydroxy-tetrahydrodipicolinate synthase [Marispirochaeta sp.]
MNFEGVFTALVTPFNSDGSLDEGALRNHVEAQITGGVAGLVPMGTTGESATLSHEEHVHAIGIVIDQAKKRVPVIAGTGSNSTQEAIDMSRRAVELGADATLQVAPYYNKPGQEGFYAHFSAVADAVAVPHILYNIPGRCAQNVEAETILRLAKHPNIAGIKEASGSLAQVMKLIAESPAGFSVLSGDDAWGFPFVALGGQGVVSVASNVIPEKLSRMIASGLAGDIAAAREQHYALLDFFGSLFVETNPVPVKYALAVQGKMRESYRLPLVPLKAESKRVVEDSMKKIGL